MSRLSQRFLAVFGVLLLIATALIAGFHLGQWLLPSVFGPLPPWLPEDLWLGLGYRSGADLLAWVPTLAFSAILLAFRYQIKTEELPTEPHASLTRISVLAVVLTVLFAGLSLAGEPWVDSQLDDLQFRQAQARQLEDAYLHLKDQGPDHQSASDLQARLILLQRLGLLRPQQSQFAGERFDYDFELQILKAHFDLDEFFRLRALPGVEGAPDETKATVADLLSRAEEALADGSDERAYQANLWGFQAYRRLVNGSEQGKAIAPADLERARVVVDRSWDVIYEKTLNTDERKKASYFFRKGKSLGDYQFQNYLEAFYGFQELHRENPRDAEVTRYWQLSGEKAADLVLFREDMDVLFAVPGSQDLVFLNRRVPTEVVRIGKLLNTSQGVYLKDFEFLRFNDEGQVLLHWTAPYGRWDDRGIDFRVWDKEDPQPRFPVVLAETAGDEYDPLGSVDPPRFVPAVTVRDLELVNADQPRPQTLGTWELLTHGQAIEALGYNSRLFQTEFLVRMSTPLGFFLAFLFVFALAWRHRVAEPGRRWWWLVPILPLVAEFFVQVAGWAYRLAVGGLLTETGLETTAGTIVLAFVALAVVAVILVQRELSRPVDPSSQP